MILHEWQARKITSKAMKELAPNGPPSVLGWLIRANGRCGDKFRLKGGVIPDGAMQQLKDWALVDDGEGKYTPLGLFMVGRLKREFGSYADHVP